MEMEDMQIPHCKTQEKRYSLLEGHKLFHVHLTLPWSGGVISKCHTEWKTKQPLRNSFFFLPDIDETKTTGQPSHNMMTDGQPKANPGQNDDLSFACG